VTVHDLGYRYFPLAHTRLSRLYLDLTTRYSARRASMILADSQATADDLTRFYGDLRHKIQVVYPGVDPPLISSINIRELYNLPDRYFLFIGTLQPRKNIARIVKAYAMYRALAHAQNAEPAGLVMAGREGWLYEASWFDDVDGVQHLGYIEEVDKGVLYAGALGLVFPTLYEGFGFPVIEAMHCGTPVIASTTSSLPELVGKAGLLVDPLDVEAIATAMQRLADDVPLRTELRQRGYQQVGRFTWDIAAQQVLQVFEEVVR
jgi:glycosyltransferase involved in cell wall biosynthesis